MKTHIIATGRNRRLEFDIDFQSGEFFVVGDEKSKREAVGMISAWAAEVAETGRIGAPWQQSYPASNPLRDPASMALAIYCQGFDKIEGPLAEYPRPEAEESPAGHLN
jgi:hypothetical protein